MAMTGNVVVDDIQTEETAPARRSPVWLVAAGGAALVALFAIAGAPEPAPTPPTLTIPEVVVPEDRWERLDLPGPGPLRAVTQLGDGAFVAAGDGPHFWYSGGDSRWSWMPADAAVSGPPGSPAAVVAFGKGAVAVGTATLADSTRRAAVWVSPDLDHWETVWPTGGDDADSGLDGVHLVDGTLVAWGWRGTPEPFSPAAEPLLLTSTDGVEWRELPVPSTDARIYQVRWGPGERWWLTGGARWWATGYEIGRPAFWVSEDLESWQALPSRGLPFGWAMIDLAGPPEGEPLTATLLDLESGQVRRWQLHEDGEWVAQSEHPGEPSTITFHLVEQFGAGEGKLWVFDDEWDALALDGEVNAVANRVAVGGRDRQPSLWMLEPDAELSYSAPAVDGAHWERVADLGPGEEVAAVPVGGAWLISARSGADEIWWYLDDTGADQIEPGWDGLAQVQPVGDEWLAVPSMRWSRDGRAWEERGWPTEGAGADTHVLAARQEPDGSITMVTVTYGTTRRVWRSDDRGATWEEVAETPAATPMWAVSPTGEGFVATAARQRGTEAIVTSRDGLNWEEVEGMRYLLPTVLPAAVTDRGTVVLFDTGQEIRPPRLDIVALTRAGDRLVLLAGGGVWVGPGDWVQLPLDPGHGMVGSSIRPLALGDRILAVASDGERAELYEWRD